jgi:hypothetical protein
MRNLVDVEIVVISGPPVHLIRWRELFFYYYIINTIL